MIKKYIYITILVTFSISSEISVFGAGDLESKNPYGLTSAEKVIVKNKQTLDANQKTIKKVDYSIKQLSEKIDGLESIYEGDGQKLNKLYLNFNTHLEEFKSIKSIIDINQEESNKRILLLSDSLDKLKNEIDININNIKTLKDSFEKIVLVVNDINSKYVTKQEFNKLIEILDKKSKESSKKADKKTDIFTKPKKELLEEARAFYKKDYFTNALPIFEFLIKNNYRPAECNYYVGEIKYHRKKYKDALHFFKKSMMLYDKAKYLPTLLLHSAISFDKTGQKDNALKFYTTLVEVYPDTNEAKEASKKIK